MFGESEEAPLRWKRLLRAHSTPGSIPAIVASNPKNSKEKTRKEKKKKKDFFARLNSSSFIMIHICVPPSQAG
jgi:hypothetical protein